MQRRLFLQTAAAASLLRAAGKFDLATIERPRVLKAANEYLTAAPVTVTASSSPRSAGGKHDFFSEGDYWWPDPNNPDEADAHLKMLQARPRGGPSIVVIDAQVGQRTRALSIFCKHEWETLVYEGPIPSVNRGVTRCKWCLGVRPY